MSAPTDRVLVGVGPPNVLTLRVLSSASLPDLTVVTGASIRVRRPDQTTATWACTIASQAAALLVLHHAFAVNDVPTQGRYRLAIDLTVPGGTVTCEPADLRAEDAV
jgi:hypothetical protein